MLYVMICYKSMTSDYCFHTSNILKSNKHHLKIQNISSFEIKTEPVQVILKCKNTLIPTKLFQNVICSDELQINDLRLLFSYFKSPTKTINIISKSQNLFILNPKRNQFKLFGNAKTYFFLQNFFRMLYVVMSY